MKTQAAQAAALIRKEIKAAFPGLKFKCQSENYAGGNSINIYLVDQPKEVADQIEAMTAKYEYGHFDGMTDTYHYSNSREDIPQVKFLFVKNEISDEKKQEIWTKIRQKWAGADALPADYWDACQMHVPAAGEYVNTLVHREFHQVN